MKVFISSPGDVQPERRLATRILAKLGRQYRQFDPIEVFVSEYYPSQGVPIPIQAQLPKTDEYDMLVCIVWNRMGTPLPGQVVTESGTVELLGPNGESGLTGTEYEFVWALSGWKQRGLPMLMVYRKNAPSPGGRRVAPSDRSTRSCRRVTSALLDDSCLRT